MIISPCFLHTLGIYLFVDNMFAFLICILTVHQVNAYCNVVSRFKIRLKGNELDRNMFLNVVRLDYKTL